MAAHISHKCACSWTGRPPAHRPLLRLHDSTAFPGFQGACVRQVVWGAIVHALAASPSTAAQHQVKASSAALKALAGQGCHARQAHAVAALRQQYGLGCKSTLPCHGVMHCMMDPEGSILRLHCSLRDRAGFAVLLIAQSRLCIE